jgi:hypothetical protein
MFALTVLALSLVVRIYDNVGVPAGEMASARAAAEGILEHTGIGVTWRECVSGERQGHRAYPACQVLGPLAPAEIIVRVVAAPPGHAAGSLGFSIVDLQQRSGTLATVFADRVHALSALGGTDRGQLLGRAMAHEIGHLLLGTTQHADRGLMRGVWTTIDLQKDRPWDWALSSEEGVVMRRTLATRLRRTEQPAAIVATTSAPYSADGSQQSEVDNP